MMMMMKQIRKNFESLLCHSQNHPGAMARCQWKNFCAALVFSFFVEIYVVYLTCHAPFIGNVPHKMPHFLSDARKTISEAKGVCGVTGIVVQFFDMM